MRNILILVILAFTVRFINISSQPPGLYWDEYDTGYQAYSLLKTGRDYFGNLMPAHLHSMADYRSGLYMYLTVPFIKFLGMTPLSVRLPAAILSLTTLFFVYYLALNWLQMGKLSCLPVMVMAFSPWPLIQARIAAESMIMITFFLLGLAGFFNWLRNGRYLWASALGFSLTLWSYGTAKMFLPLFFLLLFIVYLPLFKNLKFKITKFAVPVLLFILISLPPVYETFAKPIARRFSEISVFTDPTTSSQINYQRLEAALGGGKPREVGMVPSVWEKAVYNKLTLWGSKIVSNYASSLSTDFLFILGDPNLRHNIGLTNTGQFYLVEIIPFLLGLFLILKSYPVSYKSKILTGWLLLAPLPAIITRDGGTHAPRLLFLFPVTVFIISLGLKSLFRKKLFSFCYMLIYLFSIIITVYYFFTTYRVTSAGSFNSGFSPAIELAMANRNKYDRVIVDTHNESMLLPYLFVSKTDPAIFQKSFPLPSEDLPGGISGFKFGNILLLYPGTRDWSTMKLPGKNLVISVSDQPSVGNMHPLEIINNPDSSPAFFAFSL
jgi:4-amino-4-deoxy-L-arabinose transferase-like glycosyltransferase